ncbi:type I secretion system permease/ATPase [Stenotrophomonas sp. Iso1]|uniref:type I secretion system permease/ATPase n=1 Tax=Stenotrophomonas sp. Iso1 TaxID=2977283 RepID=UPI0022B7BE83|nr:type I secretion system permease/ATPase [Stenotrophomonas sp. Iso1]
MNIAAETETSALADLSGWVDAILRVANHYRIDCSPEAIRIAAEWEGKAGERRPVEQRVPQLARQVGLALRWVAPDPTRLTPWRLPMMVQLKDGQVGVVTAMTEAGFTLELGGDRGLPTTLDAAALNAVVMRMAVARPMRSVPDSRVDDYIKPFEPGWLRHLVLADMRPYRHILLASLVTNFLGIASILFSMQVYDRVVPAQSMPTLYVLFGGVLFAMVFAYVLRQARTRITDVLGKRADLRVSDKVFGHALRVRNAARPKSTGTFISQLRELESVRDMLTSTTIAAVADVPFFLLFCVMFWYIAGSLVWIPVLAAILMVLPGILLQKRLRALAQEGMRESSLRNAMLVEAVQGIEDIKLLQAEPRFQTHWNHYNEINADTGMKLRDLTGTLNNWAQTVQTGVFTVVVFVGAPMVMEGDITTGVLVAASMLSSRMLGPLASLTQILSRWQQARIAKEALDNLLRMPVDNPDHGKRIHRASLAGRYVFTNAVFSHDGKQPSLKIGGLRVRSGERIAILGRNGAGKSTLLRALSGMMDPQTGHVLLDDVPLSHIDPADVRRDVGFLSQESRLFYGTLRENLLMGAPTATDEELMEALRAGGAWTYVCALPDGLDHVVLEGGLGLSGGQRQSLMLARLLVRNPNVLLLDEPSASLDEAAEQGVIQTLAGLPETTTMVIATHRMAMLQLVKRVLVVDNGQVLLDGPRDEVIEKLRGKAPGSSRSTGTRAAYKLSVGTTKMKTQSDQAAQGGEGADVSDAPAEDKA